MLLLVINMAFEVPPLFELITLITIQSVIIYMPSQIHEKSEILHNNCCIILGCLLVLEFET